MFQSLDDNPMIPHEKASDRKLKKPGDFTILTVDDEVPTLKAVSGTLRDAGFNVLEAVDGEQGLEVALVKHPDVILLDIQMPKMDGLEMLRRLRKDEWGKDVKVVLLTQLSGTDKVLEAVSLGAYEYLVKADRDLSDIVAEVKRELQLK